MSDEGVPATKAPGAAAGDAGIFGIEGAPGGEPGVGAAAPPVAVGGVAPPPPLAGFGPTAGVGATPPLAPAEGQPVPPLEPGTMRVGVRSVDGATHVVTLAMTALVRELKAAYVRARCAYGFPVWAAHSTYA